MTRLVLLDQKLRREVGATTGMEGAVVDVGQVENTGLPCRPEERMILIMASGNIIYYLLLSFTLLNWPY